MEQFDAIVLGAGGAGLMCAAMAGQRGRRVVVLDHNVEPGRKIVISGGGRCNFTNREAVPERYVSTNPHFAKSALGRYTAQDFLTLVERHGIAWHEKTLGQLFCDGSARQIVAMLLGECELGQVTLRLGGALGEIGHADARYTVDHAGRRYSAPSLVIATGGPSIPKLGATGLAYDLARRFGLKVVEPRPALVPLTLPADEALFRALSGVATPVVAGSRPAKGKGASFAEAALFTHRGLSGPAILQVSSYWCAGEAVAIDLVPSATPGWLREAKRVRPRATLAEGFAKAEVTVGGIATAGLSSKTMEARHLPGLYAIGEAVDVTGWLGGYNFQWAWASGWAAAQAV
jgi:predicted Rossmann fold flavoprotein